MNTDTDNAGGPDADHDDAPTDEAHTDSDQLQRFWAVASLHADLGEVEVFMGTSWGQAMAPPAWSFGSTPELADELVNRVLSGDKTATTGPYQDYVDDEPLPKVGDLSIVLDGAGTPKALIRDVEVVTTTFGQITAEQAAAEGEGDRSLDHWREVHRQAFSSYGYEVDDSTKVVWERFVVLYP
ncbi:MAG: ASCH domain-containing protein [Propionibacteriaceae bacterium]|jgi:uncharacterized protein YhfF|nr:ASCH domain-containing protein [Propionibacteriaceae bacterium]